MGDASERGSFTRRDMLALMAGTAGAALLPGMARADDSVSGSLSLGITASQEPPFRAVVAAYQKARPNVKIEFNVLPGGQDQLRQNLITRQMANRLPDVINTYDRFPRQFADAGLTADLKPLLNSGGKVTESYFAAPFLGSYRVVGGKHAGEIHALPIGADTVILYYNKAHFDEAKLAYPDESWTWDKLIEVARQLTKKENGRTSRFGFGVNYSWSSGYVPMIKANGGSFLGDDGLVHLADEAGIKTYHTYLDHVQEGIFIDPATAKSAGDENLAFASGQCSMISSVRNSLPRIRHAMPQGFDFDVAFQPTINGTRTTGMGSVGVAVTPVGIKNPVVADFLGFFYAGDGGMAELVKTYAVVPPVVELYNSPIWRDLPPPPHSNQIFVDSIQYGIPNPAGIPADSQSTIDQSMANMVQAVLIGGQKVEDALKDAETKINEAIKRFQSAA